MKDAHEQHHGFSRGPLWEGMAWLMIVGLALATVLTLVVVPCLYAIFVERFKMKPFPVAESPGEEGGGE